MERKLVFSDEAHETSFKASIPEKNALHSAIIKKVDQRRIERYRNLPSEVIHHLHKGTALKLYRLNAADLARTGIVTLIRKSHLPVKE